MYLDKHNQEVNTNPATPIGFSSTSFETFSLCAHARDTYAQAICFPCLCAMLFQSPLFSDASFRRTLTAAVLLTSLLAPVQAQPANPAPITLAEVPVIATTPVGGTGIPLGKFAGNVQTLSPDNLGPDASGLQQKMDQALGSVHISDTQGSPFQADVNYRGFTASPALGTPQGLSVFLDGVRLNEPFGDVVSWDAIPQLAIDKINLIPGSNPVYGLNTLGGAIALTTKTGARFQGSQGGVSVGSFGRVSVDVEHGSRNDDGNLYFAASLYNERGWAANNPSQVRQVFGTFTHYLERGELAVSLQYADNLLYGNQTVPLSMLDQAAQGYSHPDYSAGQSWLLNVRGNWELDSSNSLMGNVYLRDIHRDILNSNITDVVSGATNDPSCISNSPIDCPASNLHAQYHQQVVGSNLQWSNTDFVFDRNQISTLGLNVEFSDTAFTNRGQYATVDVSHGMVGAGDYVLQADIRSHNERFGLFATSTIDATDRLSVTASARYDFASVNLSGTSCIDSVLCDLAAGQGQSTPVVGEHSYHRLNPSLGMTYQFLPDLHGFASYAEGFRTPSAIELACADPAAPCSGVPNAFGADPELAAVVSRTVEVGLRGQLGVHKWRAAIYRTALENDILFNQSSLNTGYFSNVGQTLRQGFEFGVEGKSGALDYALDLDRIEATYESSFAVANTANSAATTPVQAGNRIPGIPQWVFKGRLGYAFNGQTRGALSVQAQGPAYARGDDNNLDANGQVSGFTTVKLEVQHSVGRSVNLYAGINNLFDARYANYGALANNNLASGAAEQFQSLGAPRSFFAGLQARF